MYRKDRYGYLISLYEDAKTKGYKLGAKLVRGAYMEKERDRAEEEQYSSPIYDTKAEVDADFDRAILFCVDHYEEIASCAATHNVQSCLYQAELIGDRNLPRNHPHLNFCQLYGMSDHITFNLAANGYNVAKYVVYGKVAEVVPYLSRRAEENTATQGEFGREYQLLLTESNRRKRSR
jgi:proline dehydrogenase